MANVPPAGRGRWRWSNVPVPEPLLAAIGAAAALHVVAPIRLPMGAAARAVIGLPLLASGIALAGWAVGSAGEVDVDRSEGLVTEGAYRVTRNPMYVGWVIAVLGVAVLTRSAWLALTLAVAARALHRDVLTEERLLSERFGAVFDDYRASTPRYLPSGERPG